MENISEHITYNEATISKNHPNIKNIPNENHLKAMKEVANECFEPLRKWYNKPITINSFYRCLELNEIVGGSKTSDHMKGAAIDITGGSKEKNKELFDWCKTNLKFDQLIWEFDGSWVHISYKEDNNRNQILNIK